MGFTVKEVEEIVNEHNNSEDYGAGIEGLCAELRDYSNSDLEYKFEGLPTIRYVDSGGGEGDGAEMWVVFSVKDQLFRMMGYYSSWGDNSWDGELEEVKAVQVERTEYEAK